MAFPSSNDSSFEGSGELSILERGQAALAEGRVTDALSVAGDMLSSNPRNAQAWELRGAAYTRAGQLQDAVQAFTEWVKVDAGSANAHYNLARALLTAGDRKRARSHFQICLAFEPDYNRASDALQGMGGTPDLPPSSPPADSTLVASGRAGGSTLIGSGAAGIPPAALPSPDRSPDADLLLATPIDGGWRFRGDLEAGARGWATSAVMLGVLSLIWFLVMTVASRTTLPGCLAYTASFLVAGGFVAAGIGALQRRSWGRGGLVVAASLAGVLSIVNLVVLWSTTTAHVRPGIATAAARHPQAAVQLYGAEHLLTTAGMLPFLVVALIEISYCMLMIYYIRGD